MRNIKKCAGIINKIMARTKNLFFYRHFARGAGVTSCTKFASVMLSVIMIIGLAVPMLPQLSASSATNTPKWFRPGTDEIGLLGDVDKNGSVSVKDATMLQKYIAKIETVVKSFSEDQMLLSSIMSEESKDYKGITEGPLKINIKCATLIQKHVAKFATDELKRLKIGEKVYRNPPASSGTTNASISTGATNTSISTSTTSTSSSVGVTEPSESTKPSGTTSTSSSTVSTNSTNSTNNTSGTANTNSTNSTNNTNSTSSTNNTNSTTGRTDPTETTGATTSTTIPEPTTRPTNPSTGTTANTTSTTVPPTTYPPYPVILTIAADLLTNTGATLHGRIVSNGGVTITEYGFYFGTTKSSLTKLTPVGTNNPAIPHDIKYDLNDLSLNTTYYFKAYVIGSTGEETGEVLEFTTKPRNPVDYNTAINAEAVESNTIYKSNGNNSFSHKFAAAVMKTMLAPLPEYLLSDGKTPAAKGTAGASEVTSAKQLCDWMDAYGTTIYGWNQVSAQEAQNRADNGYPTLALWYSTKGTLDHHIQVVRPQGGGKTYSLSLGPVVAQAGLINFNYGNSIGILGDLQYDLTKFKYFTHD